MFRKDQINKGNGQAVVWKKKGDSADAFGVDGPRGFHVVTAKSPAASGQPARLSCIGGVPNA
jgi:hypothetical protein